MPEMNAFDDSSKISKTIKFYKTDTDFLQDLIESIGRGIKETVCQFAGEGGQSRLIHYYTNMKSGLVPYVIDRHLENPVLRLGDNYRLANDYEVFYLNDPSDFGVQYFKERTQLKGTHPLLKILAITVLHKLKEDPCRGWKAASEGLGSKLFKESEKSTKDLTDGEILSLRVHTLLSLTRESVFCTNNEGGPFRKLIMQDGTELIQFFPIHDNLFPTYDKAKGIGCFTTSGGEIITTLPVQTINPLSVIEEKTSVGREYELLIINQMQQDSRYHATVMPHNEILVGSNNTL